MKHIIWCEVSCGRCGATARASGYYSPDRIKALKKETKDWRDDENYRVLCPDCNAASKRKYNHIGSIQTTKHPPGNPRVFSFFGPNPRTFNVSR